MFEVEILDTGRGVDEANIPRLFDRFFGVAPADTEGSGLGLSIAASVAVRHKMKIELANRASRPGFRSWSPVASVADSSFAANFAALASAWTICAGEQPELQVALPLLRIGARFCAVVPQRGNSDDELRPNPRTAAVALTRSQRSRPISDHEGSLDHGRRNRSGPTVDASNLGLTATSWIMTGLCRCVGRAASPDALCSVVDWLTVVLISVVGTLISSDRFGRRDGGQPDYDVDSVRRDPHRGVYIVVSR